MDLAAFRVRFPEFGDGVTTGVPDTLVNACLAAAALELSADRWGSLYNEGHGLLAAHKIALSPWGNAAQLVNKNGSTTYQTHYDRLVGIVGGGGMVI